MIDSTKLLYILPDVAYVAELLPGKKPHTFAIQTFRQINGEFIDDNELIPAHVEKLIKKIDPESYHLVLPDFLFTNTIVEIDSTSDSKIKSHLKDSLLPSLNLKKDTHDFKTFTLAQYNNKTKVQLAALEKSVLEPIRQPANDKKVVITGISPLSWTIKSIVSLEPSITIIQIGAMLYGALHYIGVDQAVIVPVEDAVNIADTIKTLKGSEPSIQTVYLLTNDLVEEKLKEALSDTLPLQQLTQNNDDIKDLPSYVKQIIESGARTLDISDFPVPVFELGKSTGGSTTAATSTEVEADEESEDTSDNEDETKSEKSATPTPKIEAVDIFADDDESEDDSDDKSNEDDEDDAELNLPKPATVGAVTATAAGTVAAASSVASAASTAAGSVASSIATEATPKAEPDPNVDAATIETIADTTPNESGETSSKSPSTEPKPMTLDEHTAEVLEQERKPEAAQDESTDDNVSLADMAQAEAGSADTSANSTDSSSNSKDDEDSMSLSDLAAGGASSAATSTDTKPTLDSTTNTVSDDDNVSLADMAQAEAGGANTSANSIDSSSDNKDEDNEKTDPTTSETSSSSTDTSTTDDSADSAKDVADSSSPTSPTEIQTDDAAKSNDSKDGNTSLDSFATKDSSSTSLSQFAHTSTPATISTTPTQTDQKESNKTTDGSSMVTPTTSSTSSSNQPPVIKNKSGVNSMLKMVFLTIGAFAITVAVGIGIGYGVLQMSSNSSEDADQTSPVVVAEDSGETPEPTTEPSPSPSPEPEIDPAELEILVVNATTTPGMAGEIKSDLVDKGFTNGNITASNARGDYDGSGIFVLLTEANPALVDLISEATGEDAIYDEDLDIGVEDTADAYDAVVVYALTETTAEETDTADETAADETAE